MHSPTIAEHWGKPNIYESIIAAFDRMAKPLASVTLDDLAPVDHFHARGFPATVDLADRLPIERGARILDIGCGIGGPARYMATRFDCHVTGIDITPSFVETANKLTALLGLAQQVTFDRGDAQRMPYPDATFDGAYSQHVTMNVPDRPAFYAEAFRVLKPGAFLAVTERPGKQGQSLSSASVVRG
jgi:ubiquinone/menaquinone biosynthesis C-methylase UbiE